MPQNDKQEQKPTMFKTPLERVDEVLAANKNADLARSDKFKEPHRHAVERAKAKEQQLWTELERKVKESLSDAMKGFATWEQVMMEIWLMAVELQAAIDSSTKLMLRDTTLTERLSFFGHKGLDAMKQQGDAFKQRLGDIKTYYQQQETQPTEPSEHQAAAGMPL